MRPEAGAQKSFPQDKNKPPQQYRFDSSLAPELQWDENREEGEEVLAKIQNAQSLDEAKALAKQLENISNPFLNWTGKAEQGNNLLVNTAPLFVHERLSTAAILDTLQGHEKRGRQNTLNLFGESPKSILEKNQQAYEHVNGWQNRLILGDSLEVINSLLQYESLGGQVQMVYIDPPYGIKFGSNFQPFIRKRDVKDGDDEHLSREPEMVQAYRDTWELGIHSWLTYMRERLLLTRELLNDSGSCFVQISDENVHLVRCVMDEVFGRENFVSQINYQTTTSATSKLLGTTGDYIIWYAKDIARIKFRQLYLEKKLGEVGVGQYTWLEKKNGERKNCGNYEKLIEELSDDCRIFRRSDITSSRPASGNDVREYTFNGKIYTPGKGTFKTDLQGLKNLEKSGRLVVVGNKLNYVRYFDDFPAYPISNMWSDTGGASQKSYVVQTATKVIQRCMLMTTNPGDLVFDPTCGSGTTAMVAEQWGRRWITTDVSRVPLALARQRLLTATFDYYHLKERERGPASGFVYERKQNKKGEEVGGIVPHITLKSIANNEPPAEEVLVDKPKIQTDTVRISGPFCVEAIMPPATAPEETPADAAEDDKHIERMLSILRRVSTVRLPDNQTATIAEVRVPPRSLHLHGEGKFCAGDKEEAAALIFGSRRAALTERQIHEAAEEAAAKTYARLLVIGFAITPDARKYIDSCLFLPSLYIQASTDLTMMDLLKNMRSSEIFSVCGLPDVEVLGAGKNAKGDDLWQVKLCGLDVFDPGDMKSRSLLGNDVPCWMLDTDYDGQCFRAGQVFFPRTSAWDKIRRAVKMDFDEDVWYHLAGDTSAPFLAGDEGQVAVKVIDDRGNELIVVKKLEVEK